MKKIDRLARVETLLLANHLQQTSKEHAKEGAMSRLLRALRVALTCNEVNYESAIAGLGKRMNGHAMTVADAAALSSLRIDDLATMGMTPAELVNLLHRIHSEF